MKLSMERFLRVRIALLGAVGLIGLLVWLPFIFPGQTTSDVLQVRFLDVGQGDAIQIITPDGYEALIDGGLTSAVLRELSAGRSWLDRSIDLVIATHPDADHIGGLVDVLERYQVEWILQTDNQHNTPVTDALAWSVAAEGALVAIAQAGQVIQLGASTTLTIFGPTGSTANWPSNSASIIIKVSFGDIDFLLTGDAPSTIEEYLVARFSSLLESEVLKLGHHGSNTSTSDRFLDTVKPDFAVVSAAKDNRYGHPHPGVIKRVQERNIPIVSTAESGTITFETNGIEVWRK